MFNHALIMSPDSNISNSVKQLHPLFQVFDDFSFLGESLTVVFIYMYTYIFKYTPKPVCPQHPALYAYMHVSVSLLDHLITSNIWKKPLV